MEDKSVISFEKMNITKEEISKMSMGQKRQYLMLTNMLRDLNLLQKLLIFTGKCDEGEEILKAAYVTISFFFVITLASKIHEIWKFINSEKILNNKDNFPPEVKTALEKVEEFFLESKIKKIFKFIRDKLSFHYENRNENRENIESWISDIMDKLPNLEMWLSTNDSGNDVFSSSNTVLLYVIFRKMKKEGFRGDEKSLTDQLVKATIDISGLLREFCVQYLTGVILKNIILQSEKKIDISAPKVSDIRLSLIVKRDI